MRWRSAIAYEPIGNNVLLCSAGLSTLIQDAPRLSFRHRNHKGSQKTVFMKELRFAILGTGFWSRYQLAAWRELTGARCVALYNRTRAKAEILAQEFAVPAVYDIAEELIAREQPDFVDVITDVNTHRSFVELAAAHRTPVICQKPLAPTLADARAMVATCQQAGVPLFVHENWRWQTPLRELKRVMDANPVGRVFRARVTYSNSFPVFDNQPFLKELRAVHPHRYWHAHPGCDTDDLR